MAALLRSAARGVLQRPASFRRGLLGDQRFSTHSSTRGHERVLSPQGTKAVERIPENLDGLERSLDRLGEALEKLKQEIRYKVKRDRRNQLLLRACLLGGVGGAIYMMRRVFGGSSSQDDSQTT